jgi:excisionase family DNA binding protein
MTPRTLPQNDRDAGEAPSRPVRGRRHRDDQFFTIAEVAERLNVATRTVRRWIKVGDLVVHRIGNVVRIADSDLRAFLAFHREG